MNDWNNGKVSGALGDLSKGETFVSVVMPIRNEASFIRRSLGSVLGQDYPEDRIEIIVADGMSTDGTRDIVAALQAENAQLRLVDNPGQIVSTGLNAALKQVRGNVIIRVDGHTIIAPDYVRRCVVALSRTGADNVGGKMTAVSEGPFGQAVALATSSRFGVGGARFHYSDAEGWVDTVYMGAWPRQVFERIGLFDEELTRNQDDEFNYRLRECRGRILLDPAIKSQYYNRSSPSSLWRQYFQYGFWKVRVMQKHPGQMNARHFAPPAFVASLLVFGLFAPVSRMSLRLFATIAGTYLLANLSASAVVARSHGLKSLPLVASAFAILHLSYGLGFISGLKKFRMRWGDNRMGTGSCIRPEPPLAQETTVTA